MTQSHWSVAPLFVQGTGVEGDRLDARCITRMFVMSTDADVVTSIMDFIPEIIWHSGIKNIPLKRIYDTLMDCFDFSGPHPVVIPKLRDVAYLSARAFAHIELQRRCITQYEEHKRDSWKALCASHPLLSPTDYGPDSDLKSALFLVDMTLGGGNWFPWGQTQMTPPHRAWMSHVSLYRAWNEGQSLSEVVIGFVENSMSLRPPSDIVITDCLFIIGLMIGVSFHVSDITVRDKSREKRPALGNLFRVLSATFSSESTQTPSALRALRLVTRLATPDVADASYELFKTIMSPDNLTDQHWEAARLAIHGAFQRPIGESTIPWVGEPKEILKFLDYHLGLQGAGEDHRSSIALALGATIITSHNNRPVPLIVASIRKFDCASPSFVRGMRSIVHPSGPSLLRSWAIGFIAIISDQWFNSPAPVMEPEEMSEFCEHLAVSMIDCVVFRPVTMKRGVTIFFGMLRSTEWRSHIVTRSWSILAHCTLAEEDQESFRWCLQNAIELLEFTRQLPDGEGLKWWYGTLWFHFDKLDPTARSEVERIARDMSLGDGLSDLNLYLNLIDQEVAKTRREMDGLTNDEGLTSVGIVLRARFVALEGNYRRLDRITGGQ